MLRTLSAINNGTKENFLKIRSILYLIRSDTFHSQKMDDSLPPEIWCTFSGVINETTLHQIMNSFTAAIAGNVQTVHFVIQSPGGRVAEGVALHNYLVSLPITLITYNAGAVQSAAVLAFLAGKHRTASGTATFMIHKSTTEILGRVPAWFLKQRADDLEIDDMNSEKILKKIYRHAGREMVEIRIRGFSDYIA